MVNCEVMATEWVEGVGGDKMQSLIVFQTVIFDSWPFIIADR